MPPEVKIKPFVEVAIPRPLVGDARLREFGYAIYLRLGTTQAVWTRKGRLFTECEAHWEITRRIKEVEGKA